MSYLVLAAGFALLIGAGDLLVRGATALALRLGIPALIIGLTIVAFGTSMPELMVSLRAALDGAPDIAVGSVVGSNIANVLLVLGLPTLFRATACHEPDIRQNTIYMIGATLLFIVLCYLGPLGFWHGTLLVALILTFLFVSGRQARRVRAARPVAVAAGDAADGPLEDFDGTGAMPHSWPVIAGFVVAGLAGLPIGAEMVVTGATDVARGFGVSDAVIGLTLVAFGTSLPELATTLIAALRGHGGIALGNVIGSNIFNLLAIMGLTAMVAPVPVPPGILDVDLWIMLAAALVIVPFVFRRVAITRAPAALLVLAYAGYVLFAVGGGDMQPATAAANAGILARP